MSRWFSLYEDLLLLPSPVRKIHIFPPSLLWLLNPPPLPAPARSLCLGNALVKPNMSASFQIARHHHNRGIEFLRQRIMCVCVVCVLVLPYGHSPSLMCDCLLSLLMTGWSTKALKCSSIHFLDFFFGGFNIIRRQTLWMILCLFFLAIK